MLGLVFAKILLKIYPDDKEGTIDKKFANLVNKKTCLLVAKKLDLKNDQITGDIKELIDQKNQLEIEKNELEKSYKNLSDEHGNLQVKIKQMMVEKKDDRMKKLKFDEKIDELNQETDTLLDEIEKWRM